MNKISRKELQEMLSIQSDVDMAASMACAVFRISGHVESSDTSR